MSAWFLHGAVNNMAPYDLLLTAQYQLTQRLSLLSHKAPSTFHVLVEPQGHTHIADLYRLKVAPDHHVARLHVPVEQLLLIVEVLSERTVDHRHTS